MAHPLRTLRLLSALATLSLASCTSPTDGIEAAPGAPACQLIFAEGIMKPAIQGTKPVQPLQINSRTPSILRADHNLFNVPPGPISVLIQGFGSGTSTSAALQLTGKPGEIYRFGHQPAANSETTFVVIDSQNRVVGTSHKTMQPTLSQAPLYMPTYR